MNQLRSFSFAAAQGRWLYLWLMAVQTSGVVIIYWRILPLYRQVTAEPESFEPRLGTRLWSILAIALVQTGYWIGYRCNAPLPSFTNALVAHIVMFLSRLVLTLGIAVFFFIFILQRLRSQLPFIAYCLVIVGLFSLFLYAQELQHLGNALMPNKAAKKETKNA